MKLFFSVIFAAALCYSCTTNNNKKIKNNANELTYSTVDTSAGPLSATLNLTGNIGQKELTAQIKLTNSKDAPLDIEEIVIATTEGLRSIPITGFSPFSLMKGKDSTLLLKFSPLNDLKLYRVTDMQGSFKPGYTVSVSYRVPGNDNLISLALQSQTDKNEYLAYNKKYKKPITGYSFNTKTGFNEQQKKYLETLKQVSQPPFVYLSEQEIAISGLNFRLKSYFEQDTLHAELFIVNHADFPVKIIPNAFDIVEDARPLSGETGTIIVEKLSGSQQDLTMMEKGDRVLIHFKKYLQIKVPGKENLTVLLHKSFMLTGKKNLFNEDVQLLPGQY
jgi:hypothetical protein